MDKELFERIKGVTLEHTNVRLRLYAAHATVSMPNIGQSAEGVIRELATLRKHIVTNITTELFCSDVYANGSRFYFLIEQA